MKSFFRSAFFVFLCLLAGLFFTGSSAFALSDSLLLKASKSYNPDLYSDFDTTLLVPVRLVIPEYLSVAEGSAGDGLATLKLYNAVSGDSITITYIGIANNTLAPGQLKKGMRYYFQSSSNGMKAGDISFAANRVYLRVESGNSLAGSTAIEQALPEITPTRCIAPAPASCINLVRNPSFEQTRSCNSADPHDACGWSMGTNGTSDYFQTCTSPASGYGVPSNFANNYGNNPARTGGNYMGLYVYVDDVNNPADLNVREYVAQDLVAPLIAGQRYYAELWAESPNTSQNFTNTLAIAFTPPYDLPNAQILPFTPQITSPNVIGTSWTRICGFFTANGTEQFMTIGSFTPDNATKLVTNANASGSSSDITTYYYIDDVKLSQVPSAGTDKTISCGNSVQIGKPFCDPSLTSDLITWESSPFDPSLTGHTHDYNPSVSPSQTTTYTLTYNGGAGAACSDVTRVTVFVNPPVITASPSTICPGGSSVLTASVPGATGYTWSPAASLSSSTGASVTASPASTTPYTVTAMPSGCVGKATVSVSTSPTVTLTAPGGTTLCTGPANLCATVPCTELFPGDITIVGYRQNAFPATKNIVLMPLVNMLSCQQVFVTTRTWNTTNNFTVKATASNDFPVTASAYNAGQILNFTNINPNTNQIFVYTVIGNMPRLLYGLSSNNWAGGIPAGLTNGVTAVAFNTSAPARTWNQAVNNQPQNVFLTAISNPANWAGMYTPLVNATVTGIPTGFVWKDASNNTIPSGPACTPAAPGTLGSSISVNTSGTYTVTYTDIHGCAATASISITIIPTPVITGASVVCFNQPGVNSLSVNAMPPGYTYQWRLNQKPIPGETSSIYNVPPTTAPGTYNYSVAVTSGTTTCFSANFVQTVRPSLTVSVTPASPVICAGQAVQLTATGAATYNWNPTTDLIFINPTPFISNAIANASPATTTTYTVIGSVPGNNACPGTASVTVTVNPPPTAGFTTAATSNLCLNGPVSFTNTSTNTNGSTTYLWNFGADAIPANSTAQTPSAVRYQSAGIKTISLTVTNPGCASNTFTTQITIGTGCCPVTGYQVLGVPGVNTIVPAQTFSGIYKVDGPLWFNSGTYTLSPGTIFYMEGGTEFANLTDPGAYIVVGDFGTTAELVLNSATITAFCDKMWAGIVLVGQNTITTQGTATDMSEISHSYFGVGVNAESENGNIFHIDHTRFFNNYYASIFNDQYCFPCTFNVNFFIQNCIIDSDPNTMRSPYNKTSNFNQYYAQHGILMYLSDSQQKTIQNNTIKNCLYGMRISGNINIQNNILSNNYVAGIYNDQITGQTIIGGPYVRPQIPSLINGNIITVPSQLVNTVDINSGATVVGISADGQDYTISNNTIQNNAANPNLDGKDQTGIFASTNGAYNINGNTISRLDRGVQAYNFTNASPNIFNNNFQFNVAGINVPMNPASSLAAKFTCNTFNVSGTMGTTTYGIRVDGSAFLNDQILIGGNPQPAGNKYSNIINPLYNDGSNAFTYYRYNSSDEATGTSMSGSNAGPIVTVTGLSPFQACLNQGYSNGVNAFRIAGTSFSAIQEMMDSVKYQVGTDGDINYYIYQIIKYHDDNDLVADLEIYCMSLPNHNKDAYNTICWFLIDYYVKAGQVNKAIQIKNDLVSKNPMDIEVSNRSGYYDVYWRIKHITTARNYKATTFDIATLDAVSNSGTSHSENACFLLRYYKPHNTCNVQPNPELQKKKNNQNNKKAVLSQNVPNPAKNETTIAYSLSEKFNSAKIVISDLVTQSEKEQFILNDSKGNIHIDLSNFQEGIYVYYLIVDGILIDSKKMVVIH